MKEKIVFIMLGMVLFPAMLCGQSAITLQRGEQAQFFSSFTEALAAAQQGDVMYLSGGTYNIGDVYIDKKLSIIGTGHYPSYTQATGITYLSGNIYLLAGADTTLMQGFYLSGDLRLGSTPENQEVHFVNLSRCSVDEIFLSYNGGPSTPSSMISLTENVIRGAIYGGNAQAVFINKNLIGNRLLNFDGNATFNNNIFLFNGTSSQPILYGVKSCLFNNNIFLVTTYFYGGGGVYGNGFYNNLFTHAFTINAENYGGGNIINVTHTDIFINQTGYQFSYDHDYHLKPGCPWIGAGTDGFDIGIYGSSIPYKEGAVPFTPYITTREISGESTPAGNIEVNISVEAQPR